MTIISNYTLYLRILQVVAKYSLINFVLCKGSRIDGIALEPESQLLYYADVTQHQISVMDTTGSYVKHLIAEDLLQPRGLAIDANHGYVLAIKMLFIIAY